MCLFEGRDSFCWGLYSAMAVVFALNACITAGSRKAIFSHTHTVTTNIIHIPYIQYIFIQYAFGVYAGPQPHVSNRAQRILNAHWIYKYLRYLKRIYMKKKDESHNNIGYILSHISGIWTEMNESMVESRERKVNGYAAVDIDCSTRAERAHSDLLYGYTCICANVQHATRQRQQQQQPLWFFSIWNETNEAIFLLHCTFMDILPCLAEYCWDLHSSFLRSCFVFFLYRGCL